MDINNEYYKIFYNVARYGNLTRAAGVLGSSQPNVTRVINRLENELGAILFVRSNRGVTLTPEGRLLYTHIEAAQREIMEAEAEISGATSLTGGSISIACSEIALNIFLLGRLSAFHREHPGIRLRISNDTTPQAITAIERGACDLAVVTTPSAIPRTMREKLLMPFEEILVTSADNSDVTGPVSIARLAVLPFIGMNRGTTTEVFYRRFFAEHGLEPDPDILAATSDQVLSLVRQGLGFGFLPRPFAAGSIARGEIREISLKEKIPLRYVTMISDRGRSLSVAAKAFERSLSE